MSHDHSLHLTVFGATGSVGRHVVDQALAQGHRVTAFTRRPESIEPAAGLDVGWEGTVRSRPLNEAVPDL